jgi:hypothetical protein
MTQCVKPVFTIDTDYDDLADAIDDGPVESDQRQALIQDVANRTVGTAGCCGAVCMCFGCLCCGMCWKEIRETYDRFTLCGLWCPIPDAS